MNHYLISMIFLIIILMNLQSETIHSEIKQNSESIEHLNGVSKKKAVIDDNSLYYFSNLLYSDPEKAKQYIERFHNNKSINNSINTFNKGEFYYNGLYVNGSTFEYFTKASTSAFILFFKTNDTFSMKFSFSSLIGFSISTLGTYKLNKTDPKSNLTIRDGDFLAIWAIAFTSDYPMVSNFTFIPIKTSLNLNQPLILYNFDIFLLKVGFLSFTGISHLDASFHNPKYLREGIEISLLTVQAFDHDSGSLLIEMPLPYVSFAIEAGSRDIFSFIPINRTLDVVIYFHTKEVDWVTINLHIGEPLGYQNENVSFVMLTHYIAKKLLKETEELEYNFTSLGYNLDRYKSLLKRAEYFFNTSNYHLGIASPIFEFNEVDWGTEGNKALFEAEVSIGKCQRYSSLVTKYIFNLQQDPVIYMMVIIFLMSIFLSLFTSLLFFRKTIGRMVCSLTVTGLTFLVNILVNPTIKFAIDQDSILLITTSIKISIYYLLLLSSLLVTSCLLLGIPFLSRFFSRVSLVFEFILRNIKRQKFRSSVFFITLTLITMSFTLLVSVAYKGDVISTGIQRYSSYEGIEIANIQESINGVDLVFPQLKRIPEGLLVTINASLEIYGIRNTTSILQRDFLTGTYSRNTDNYQTSTIEIKSKNNVTVSLKNYFATIPSIEASFSQLNSCIISGKWLSDTNNITNLKYSTTLLPIELAQELKVEINDSIDFHYLSNNIFTNATFNVIGIINTTQMAGIIDIDGGSIVPSKYIFNDQGYVIETIPCRGSEFILFDFLWWRSARAASYSEQLEFTQISRLGSTKIILNTTDMDFGIDLTDRLEGYEVQLSSKGIVYDLEFAIVQSIEGLVPQLLPVLIAVPIISQSVYNSLWERRKEIKIYGTIGMPLWSLILMILIEFGILALVSGAIGYLLGLSSFPVLSEFGLTEYLTQKTGSLYAILSFILSISISSLATFPFMVKVISEIVPR
ncbi:MAG: FtsX-like permease family protein, partial [Candidatus Hodarchaeota archaeon]